MNIEAIARTLIPLSSLKVLVRLAKTLLRDMPESANGPVEKTAAKMKAQIELIEDDFSARMRAKNARLIARELQFDRATDALWILLRVLLDRYARAYGHSGLELLSPERQAEIELPKLRALASRAASLHGQLFAADGTQFTRSAFTAQVESMATLLRIIEEDELGEGIASIAGPQLLPTLKACQAQYEEMVGDRMRRDMGVAANFSQHLARLRWLIDRYKNAVETLYDEDEPETLEVVEQALRPLLMLSALMARSGGSTELDEELEAELVEAEIFDEIEAAAAAELEAEAEAKAEAEAQEPAPLEPEALEAGE